MFSYPPEGPAVWVQKREGGGRPEEERRRSGQWKETDDEEEGGKTNTLSLFLINILKHVLYMKINSIN